MQLALYILCLAGAIGAFDVFYFHMYKCRLFTRPQSAAENVTHAIRALLFTAFFVVLLQVDARGAYWWIYPGLCLAELTNSMLDTYLERDSRADQGGLPHGEYCLHVLLSVLIGAVMLGMIVDSLPLRTQETALVWRSLDVPAYVVMASTASAFVGVLFFLFEGTMALRHLLGRGASVADLARA